MNDPPPPPPAIGNRFDSMADLRLACKRVALFDNFEFKTIASDKKRYTIQCITADGCLWRLHASLIASDNGDTTIVEIKTLISEHTCNGIHTARHRQASASFVSSVIEGRLRDQPGYRPTEVLRDIRRDHGVEISYSTAWRAKEQASANINGSHEDAYQQLPQYCEDILRNNPGSTVTLEHTEDNQFKRVFISYAASGMGFAHCRPVIGLDGAHLKGKYFGILLSATAVDANGSLFPLAFAVVDAENDDNWAWFAELLREVIQIHAPAFLVPRFLAFISDRQKGLLEAVELFFPGSPHGYCLRHLYENLHKKFKNPALRKLLWDAARAATPEGYDNALEKMSEITPECVPWLLEHAKPEHWAESRFDGNRYGHITSNIAESINSWLLEARELPIFAMLERIRHQLMEWFAVRREIDQNTEGLLVSSAAKIIKNTLTTRARRY